MILLMGLSVTTTHGELCFLQSTNHGGGWFSYTFQHGDDPYVWGLGTNFGFIELQCYGVLEVQDPPDWTHSVSASGRVTWMVTNGLVFLDEPVTFSVRSCLTQSAIYGTTPPSGPNDPAAYLVSVAYTRPEHEPTMFGGIQYFEFVGPALPTLSIARASPDILLRWSGDALGLQLEASAQLGAAASWTSVTNQPALVNSMFVVRLPAAEAAKFFRLSAPCNQ
jgi:hypothetical protein